MFLAFKFTQKGQKSLFIKDSLTQAEKGKAYYHKKIQQAPVKKILNRSSWVKIRNLS